MNLAAISVVALAVAVALSCVTSINVGILALAMAFGVGVFLGGMSVGGVLEGFPTDLLVTLVGVTLLFAIAECNGTLARLTSRAVRLCRGHAGVLPVVFFAIGFIVCTLGAGGTATSALLAPPAMAVAARAGVPPLLMAIMTGNGALAGSLSPFAPNGIVAHAVMRRIGLGGVEWQTFAFNALAHTLVGVGGFLLLGGWRLIRPGRTAEHAEGVFRGEAPQPGPFESRHWLTTAGIALLVVAVAGMGLHVGMMAIIISAGLILLRTVDEGQAIQRMPWSVMLMVTGVTVLIAMVEETQGLALITSGMADMSTAATIAPIVAFGTGLISVFSSTSGVVLPAFLPMVPELSRRLAGTNPLHIAWSINIGSSLVDLSSLSTVGALYIAAAAPGTDVRALFNGLLVWGLSMSVVGAALCWLLFG